MIYRISNGFFLEANFDLSSSPIVSPESFEVAGREGTDIQLQGVGTTLDVEEDEDGKSAGMEEGKDKRTSEDKSSSREKEDEVEDKENEDGLVKDFNIEEEEFEDEELTEDDRKVMKEIDTEKLDLNIEDFLKSTENSNTRDLTDHVVNKYNRVMAVVAKQKKVTFLPLKMTPQCEIPEMLATFFKLMKKKDGTDYNASSYTTFLGCFTRYLAEEFHPPIDVKNSLEFKKVRQMVGRRKKAALTSKGKKPGDNSARVIATRHLQLARSSGCIGRDNPEALLAATYLAFTCGLGCRAVREVHAVRNHCLVFGPVGKGGVPEWVELDEAWVCKNRNGNDPRQLEARLTPDHENPDTCYVRTIGEMQRRKTMRQKEPQASFWWNIKPSAKENPEAEEFWYKNNPMGIHNVEKLLINGLTKAGIDCKKEKYTGTSARKVMMDGGLDAGIPEIILGRMAGQKSEASKANYIANKDITHRAASITLSRVSAGIKANYQSILQSLQDEEREASSKTTGQVSKKKRENELMSEQDSDEEFDTIISQSKVVIMSSGVSVTAQQKEIVVSGPSHNMPSLGLNPLHNMLGHQQHGGLGRGFMHPGLGQVQEQPAFWQLQTGGLPQALQQSALGQLHGGLSPALQHLQQSALGQLQTGGQPQALGQVCGGLPQALQQSALVQLQTGGLQQSLQQSALGQLQTSGLSEILRQSAQLQLGLGQHGLGGLGNLHPGLGQFQPNYSPAFQQSFHPNLIQTQPPGLGQQYLPALGQINFQVNFRVIISKV